MFQVIYFGSYLVFPFLIFCLVALVLLKPRWLWIVLTVLSLLFVYARFVEPQQIVINESDWGSGDNELRIAVLADLHLGVYKDADFLERVVQQVNQAEVDIVLIAGDFTYYPEKMEGTFDSLQELNAVTYAVTGNHDAKHPGEISSAEARKHLEKLGIKMIDNQRLDFKELTLIGLSDLWEGEADYSILEDIDADDFVVLLTHNPDTVYRISDAKVDLAITGHTHGGQIRLPWIYKWAIPCEYDFDRGFVKVDGVTVFTTSGLGEVGLPMRFLVPPEIVILNLKY